MSKKNKNRFPLAEGFQKMINLVLRLETLIEAHKEITLGYQKYRKNGGAAISGVEKHLGIAEIDGASTVKAKKSLKIKKVKASDLKAK